MLPGALIGCGKIGSEFADDPGSRAFGVATHAGAYAACGRTQLVAVADVDLPKAERCARRWGVPAWYGDPLRLLEEQRPAVLSVCTPDHTHHELIKAALATDSVRAVLAEKPLALSDREAEELVGLSRRRGVVLAVNYSRRYASSHVRARSLVRSGGIGEVRLARGIYTKGTLHNGTHWFDLARFLIGEAVRVRGSDRLRESGDDPTLDVELEFESGARAVLHSCSADDFTAFEMDVIGTRGRVCFRDSGATVEHFAVNDGVPYVGYRGLVRHEPAEGGLADLALHALENLIDCLETGSVPRCTGEDALRALRIALAARDSVHRGGPWVELPGHTS